MAKLTALFLFLGTTIIVSSCSETPPPIKNKYGWTFCSCNSAYTDTKGELATESDADEREIIKIELEIMEEECGEFLSKAKPGTEKFKQYMLDRANCR